MHTSPLSRLVASSCEGRTREVDNEKKVSSIPVLPLLPRLVSDLHRFISNFSPHCAPELNYTLHHHSRQWVLQHTP